MQTVKRLFAGGGAENYDYSVSFARIVGMLFIVACHIGNYFNNAIVSQFFNVGVPLFFVISGGLCANKEIKQPCKWLARRFVRIYMPLLAWTLYYLFSVLIDRNQSLGKETVFALSLMLLNLQGLRHLFSNFIWVDGPWFFTVIMLCYALVIPYKRLENKFHTKNFELFTGCCLFALTGWASRIGIDLTGFLYFFAGYILTKLGYNCHTREYSCVAIAALICGSSIVRLVSRQVLDGFWLYDSLIVPTCHLSLAIGILFGIRWIRSKGPDRFDKVMSDPLIRWLDSISIYVYVFHDVFITGALSVFRHELPDVLSIIFVYFASFCMATIVYIPCETLAKRLNHRVVQKLR